MSASSSSSETPSTRSSTVPSLFRSASLIAIVTFASKILGLVRDQMITHAYGASLLSDAYLYAFQIPSFSLVLLGGLGGPFHTATVSVLSKLLKGEEKPTEQAERLVNTFITLTGLAFIVLSIIAFVFAPQIIDLLAFQANTQLKTLATDQLRWMSPLIFIGGIIGIFYGVANVYHQYFWPSLSPSAINVTLILWLLIAGPDQFGYALALSTLLGGILQLVLQLPDFFRAGFRFYPVFNTKDKDLKTMGELLFPATIGTTIGQLNVYVDMFFVSTLVSGSWTAILLGNRLIQLPIGILIIAMLVPLFPRFSRWAGEKQFNELKTSFQDGVLTLWLLSFPIIALIFLLGEPAITLLFQRGAFTARDTQVVTLILGVLSLSIVPYMLRDAVTRVFYAFNNSKTPLIVGLFSIVIKGITDALWVKPFGVAGIAFSTVVVTLFNAVALTVLVRQHLTPLDLHRMVSPTLKMMLATLVASLAGYLALTYPLPWLYTSLSIENIYLKALITILLVTGLLASVYVGMLIALRVHLASRLKDRILRR